MTLRPIKVEPDYIAHILLRNLRRHNKKPSIIYRFRIKVRKKMAKWVVVKLSKRI